jgi:predicted XRE-type DNA-binding protein
MTDYDTETQDSIDHTDPDTLRRLYWDEGMSQAEMAEVLPVTQSGVKYWMNKHDIETKTAEQAAAESCRANSANYTLNNRGYHVWRSRENGREIAVGIHRLLAVAEGADPYEIFTGGTHVHHKNSIPWDNRPDNIEPLDAKKHISQHNRGEGCGTGKLTRKQVSKIRRLSKSEMNQSEIADEFEITQSNVSRIHNGEYWSHID